MNFTFFWFHSYATQIPPVFTQQYAREQRISEDNRSKDAQRLAQLNSIKNVVVAYGWSKVSTDPVVLLSLSDGL